MTGFETVNFFKDRAVQDDPYAYYDWLHAQHPVWQEQRYGIFMVSGYEEAMAVYNDATTYSSCNTIAGPFVKFSVPFEGDDVSQIIDEHRHELPFSDQLPSFDPPMHTAHRGLLMRLITPKRLSENEEFMWRLCDRHVDEFIYKGECEFISEFASPFTLLVIADLEGVPEADHSKFKAQLTSLIGGPTEHNPLEFLYGQFTEYVLDRRENPRHDVLTGLATATFPDGSTPDAKDVALIAANLFAAGQETTVRLLAFALKMLGERPDLQHAVREDRERIPNFIEETLRIESPLRGQFRMARVRTELAGVDIPAGSSVLLLPGAANRDPRMFENPYEFDIDRRNARKHLAFGFGIHTCAGAPLARAEGKVTLNRLLDRTSDIRISEAAHGPPDGRRYQYLPTYLFRGLTRLHLEFSN
ncbi:MAG: cytochrome P450 [Candidatus Eremiobacteraeota bacterium]|nr:cytochrome P450 [Candidatus Eremiobacteraeota bacterium]